MLMGKGAPQNNGLNLTSHDLLEDGPRNAASGLPISNAYIVPINQDKNNAAPLGATLFETGENSHYSACFLSIGAFWFLFEFPGRFACL